MYLNTFVVICTYVHIYMSLFMQTIQVFKVNLLTKAIKSNYHDEKAN